MSEVAAAAGLNKGNVPLEPDEQPLAFHALRFHDDGEEVTVGRLDQGEFVVLPADGGALLRQLVDGRTSEQAAEWYLTTYGEPIDVADFINDLGELGFLRAPGEPLPSVAPVRWQRLSRALFSPVAGVAYLVLVAAAVIAMVRSPVLVPNYRNLFFTHYVSVLMVTLFVTQMPMILLHEAAHALAGRRLGLRSRLSIGRRLYYLVFQTTMEGLVSVPRAKRFLPILAGMLTDVGVLAALTLVAAMTARPDGTLSLVGGIALAMAYMTLLRLLWQCSFFLQTDVYYLVVTVLGCVDLHTCATQMVSNWWRDRIGRPRRYDPADWHPKDRKVARWYSLLMVAGFVVTTVTLVVGLLPAVVRVFGTVLGRLAGNGTQGAAGLLDTIAFLVLTVGEVVVALFLMLRDRRRRRAAAAQRSASSPL
jgi:hypothetical protein